MRNIAIIAALWAACAAQSVAEECTLKRIAAIPFKADETAHVYLPATIAGRATRLMLDTGAYWSVLHEELVKSLGLDTRNSPNVQLVDLSGERIDRLATVPKLQIGNLVFGQPVEFFIDKGIPGESLDDDGGVMGLNLLTHMDIEIDNAGKTVSFFTQDHCKGDGVYWADEAVTLQFRKQRPDQPIGTRIRRPNEHEINLPIVAAELEGDVVSTLFDTGSTVTAIDIDHAKRRFGIGPGSPGVEPAGKSYLPSGNVVDLYSYTFKSLTISGIKFENVPVHLGKFESAQLILGMHELKNLRLFFAFKDGMIHITAADAGQSK